MPVELITRAELADYAKRAGVSGFTDSQYDEAIAGMVGTIRQAALNDYTPTSFELLTIDTTPDDMRRHALAIALEQATAGDAGRPESIDKANDKATRWLGFLSGGTTHYDELPDPVLVKRTQSSGAVTHRRKSDRVFSPDNPEFASRDEPI